MNATKNMKLPADCALMTKEEMMYTDGGSAVETALKAALVVGGAVVLLVVGSNVARGILSILGGEDGLDGAIDSSVDAGKGFIDSALDAGQDWLDSVMGR